MLPNQFIRLCLTLFVLWFYVPFSYAQSTLNVDSLLKLVNHNNPDSVNGQIYYELARKSYASDTKNALVWAREGAKYFEKNNSIALMTRCMNIEGVCLFILDRHEESLKLHYNVLKIRENMKDTLAMAESLLNIGNVFYRGKDIEQSIKFYQKSREYAQKKNNSKLLASLNNNLGNYYKDKFIETKSLHFKNLAIKHLNESIYNKEKLHLDLNIANTYTTLSRVFFESKDYKSALKYAQKAEKLALQSKNDEAVGSSKLLLCEIAIAQNEIQNAERILDGIYAYIGQNKAFHILNMFDEEMVIQRDKIRNLKFNPSELKDSIQENDYNSLLLARQKVREELNIKYETQKKDLENANLILQNAIAEENIERITLLSTASIIFILILLGLLWKLKKRNNAILLAKAALKEQAHQLYEQNILLKQSESFKAKIFSIISHDLKSPINSLKLIVEMSSERQLSKEDYDYLMENMKQELDITSNLLNDLLFWSKAQMESNTIKWSYFNLFNTVSKCLNTLATNINLKQLKISNHLSSNFIVWGDEMRCEFVIRNILHNAIKYSDFYKEIEIGIKDNGEYWNFYIKDNGIGIPQEQLDKMFLNEHFRKSTPGTLNEQGAGIGLLLCHDFIESLGWSLFVESKIGVGTIFNIHIQKNDSHKNELNNNKKIEDPSQLQLQ